MLPAASVAVTDRTWAPTARSSYVIGEVHGCGALPSSAQVNVTSLSEALKLIVALGGVRFGSETEPIVVTGGPVSEIHVALGGVGSLLPAWSLAATLNVCGPSGRPV
jgi:hypothetical protein